MKLRTWLLIGWGWLTLEGCSQSPYELAPVSGVVTIDGQPFTQGKVMFAPRARGGDGKAGKPAMGRVGPDGGYTLTTYEDGDGAVVGDHWVTVMHDLAEEEAPKPPFDRVQVPTKVTVSSGQPNLIDVTLTKDIISRYGVKP